MNYYCEEHKFNPQPGSGMGFCPQCEAADLPSDAPEGKTALEGQPMDSNAPSVNVGPGKGITCLGCGKPVATEEDWNRKGFRDGVCYLVHGCQITAESIRREVSKAVLPLVLALERLAEDQDSTTFARRNSARRLCEEERKKWGEG